MLGEGGSSHGPAQAYSGAGHPQVAGSPPRGAEVADVARHLEISEVAYYRWRARFGGMKAGDARRLKELEARTPG